MKKFLTVLTIVLMLAVIFRATVTFPENARQPSRQEIDGYMKKAAQLYDEGSYAEAITWYHKAADHGNAWGQNNLAWILATFRIPGFRDGTRAVLYALKATEQEPNNPAFVRTLAAAYARNGEFDKAVEVQNRVRVLLQKKNNLSEELREFLRQDHREKLELYQQHTAYVDEK